MIYLNTNGIASSEPMTDIYYTYNHVFNSFFSNTSAIWDVENQCINLYETIYKYFRPTKEELQSFLGIKFDTEEELNYLYKNIMAGSEISDFYFKGGISSESTISEKSFFEFFEGSPSVYNRILYNQDVAKVVAGIQTCNMEIEVLMGTFFEKLCLSDYFEKTDSNGLMATFNNPATTIQAMLFSTIVRCGSLLDYCGCLAQIVDSLPVDFDSYKPIRRQKNFGQISKNNRFKKLAGNIFSNSLDVDFIRETRNRYIHENTNSENPICYSYFDNGVLKERFVLVQDRPEISKNYIRNNFFSNDHKINETLPVKINNFRVLIASTLKQINDVLVSECRKYDCKDQSHK